MTLTDELAAHQGSALLLELSAPVPGEIAQFHEWYEHEQIPSRLREVNVLGARRFHEDGRADEWLALYELAIADAAHVVTASRMRESFRGVPTKLPRFEQRVYERLPVPDVARAGQACDQPILMAVWWTPEEGTDNDFNAWYAEEHIPMLMAVPGWCAIERYHLASGTGPVYLALHHLESIDVLTHPAHRRAVDTPWRVKVAERRQQHERRIFRQQSSVVRTPVAGAEVGQ